MLINKHNLAVADFAPKEESRYTLRGIQVSEKGTVATNGHYLVHVTLPKINSNDFPAIEGFTNTQTVTPFILPADAAKKIQAATPGKERIPILNNACVGEPNGTTANIAVTDLDTTQVFKPKMMTGQFPNFEKVIPTTEPVLEIGLSGSYLAQLAKAATAFTDQGGDALLLRFHGADKPVEIITYNSETEQKWYGLVMPMRTNLKEICFPKKSSEPVEEIPEVETETVA